MRVVLDGGHFFEGVRWHEDRLWVSDFFGHQVLSRGHGGDVRAEAKVATQPSGLGWLPDGRLLVVSMLDQRLLRREHTGELVEVARLTDQVAGQQLNDMVVDTQGRAYISSLGFDPHQGDPIAPAPLCRVDPDGTVTVVAEDLAMPNGLTILPDGVLVVAETLGNRLTGFDIADDGSLGNRRDWAAFGPKPATTAVPEAVSALAVVPDGLACDSFGAVWVADFPRCRAIRVAPGGEILAEVVTDGLPVFSCALGGPEGRTLYLCVAPDFSPGPRSAAAQAQVLATDVDVPR